MKKFTKILICLMLCVFGLGFVACDSRTDKEANFTYPNSSDQVVGNGGLAVKKGNYVYFVNGYKSITDEANTKKSTYSVGSLMLMKLGQDGQVVTDADGLIDDEYYITMSNKLCGYEATNLFIHGNYLYFVSPSLENESGDKTWAKERVVFNRIKLDKTSDVEEVYSSGVKFDQLEFNYYVSNNNLYILVYEKGDSYYAKNGTNALIRVDALAKNSSKVANNVSSVVFAENADEIFFVEDNNSKYYLKQYNIVENSTSDYVSEETQITVEFVAGGNVYISKKHPYGSSTDVMVSSIAKHAGFSLIYAYEGTVNVEVTPDGMALVIVDGKTITFVEDVNTTKVVTDNDATKITIIGYNNGCVFYYDTADSNSTIKFVSYYNFLTSGIDEIQTLTTLTAFEEDFARFDLAEDDNYMYFYNKTGENYYLNRLKVRNNLGEVEEMFGVYNEADIPEVEEDEEIEE